MSKTPEEIDFFAKLTENAFIFLERSLNQIKTEPQLSLINYYTAIELFFKARLLKEHWTLIISDSKGAPKFADFCKGEFKSVTLSECAERIQNVCEEPVVAEAKKFDPLRKHRNKAVHFFHPAYAAGDSAEINQIMLEQFHCWIYLIDLFQKYWDDFFADYRDRVDSLEAKLGPHKEYLATLYEHRRESIEKEKADGIEYIECPHCKYNALRRNDENECGFTIFKCVVCKHEEEYLVSQCPHCNEDFVIFDTPKAMPCPCCKRELSEKDCIWGILELEGKDVLRERFCLHRGYRPKELDMAPYIQCHGCWGDNIIRISEDKDDNGSYCCLDCPEEYCGIVYCEYCGQANLGDDISEDDSSWGGCHFCEGALGNIKED